MREHAQAFASAARTASPTDATLSVPVRATRAQIIIDVTAINATPSVVFNVRGLVPVSGTAYLILASAAITAVGVTALTIGPGLPVTANVSDNDSLPQTLVIDPVHGDADSITYSVQVIYT